MSFPPMRSLRVTSLGNKVQVGVGGDEPVILEYPLLELQGAMRVGHEALRGHTVVEAPARAGGLYAVLGPGDMVQIRSKKEPDQQPFKELKSDFLTKNNCIRTGDSGAATKGGKKHHRRGSDSGSSGSFMKAGKWKGDTLDRELFRLC
ncbi:unnamed protein product, partial [Choristocarpus tenellus]